MEKLVLREKEKIVSSIKPVKRFLAYSLIITPFVGAVIIFILTYGLMKWGSWDSKIAIIVFVGLWVLSFIVGAPILILYYNKLVYTLTNQRIIIQQGIVGFTRTSFPLNQITEVTEGKSALEMLFGLEHVTFKVLSGAAGQMYGIENAKALRDKVWLLRKKSKPLRV